MRVPKLRSPIVLVHGFCGFTEIRAGSWLLAGYFHNIPDLLRAGGNRVLLPWLSPTAGVAERAGQLKTFLEREAPGEPVHILGHSMGGLDARYMIAHLGMAERVLTLTTIGTPHRGTAFADWGIRRLERVLKPILDLLAIPTQAIYDLTTSSCQAFNAQVPDAAGVRYFSIAGRHDGRFARPEWLLPYTIVREVEGDNDGVVSLASARYGESFEVWETDHLGLANWPDPVARSCGLWQDRSGMYAQLVGRLADEGF